MYNLICKIYFTSLLTAPFEFFVGTARPNPDLFLTYSLLISHFMCYCTVQSVFCLLGLERSILSSGSGLLFFFIRNHIKSLGNLLASLLHPSYFHKRPLNFTIGKTPSNENQYSRGILHRK